MGKQVDKCARQRKCRPKVEDSDEDKRKTELRSHSETPSESSGSTCSIIFFSEHEEDATLALTNEAEVAENEEQAEIDRWPTASRH